MNVREHILVSKATKGVLCLALLLLLSALPGYGQISFNTHGKKHEQQVRKSLKEAEQADLAYKDTHLNTNAYTFKKGAAAHKRLKQDERSGYQFNDKGKPVKWTKFFKKRKHKRAKNKQLL